MCPSQMLAASAKVRRPDTGAYSDDPLLHGTVIRENERRGRDRSISETWLSIPGSDRQLTTKNARPLGADDTGKQPSTVALTGDRAQGGSPVLSCAHSTHPHSTTPLTQSFTIPSRRAPVAVAAAGCCGLGGLSGWRRRVCRPAGA